MPGVSGQVEPGRCWGKFCGRAEKIQHHPHHLMSIPAEWALLAQCSTGFERPEEKVRVLALGKQSSSLGFFFRKQEDMGSVVSHLMRHPVILVMCLAPRACIASFPSFPKSGL